MERLNESLALLAVLNPATVNSTPATSSWVDAAAAHELLAVLAIGNMATETVDFKIEQATDSSGTAVKDLAASTQLAASAAANDNAQLLIDVKAETIDTANGFRYVRLRAVTGGATGGPMCGLLWARTRYRPSTHAASVLETVVQ